MRTFCLVFTLCFSLFSYAEMAVKIMPLRAKEVQKARRVAKAARRRVNAKRRYQSRTLQAKGGRSKGDIRLGVEGGFVGKPSSIDEDALGQRLLFGGRLISIFPLYRQIVIRPSLGFFTQASGEANLEVKQWSYELTGSIEYLSSYTSKWYWGAGLFQRLEATQSVITIDGNSDRQSLGYRYRLGPVLEVGTQVGKDFRVHTRFELGVGFAEPVTVHPGISLGFSFGGI